MGRIDWSQMRDVCLREGELKFSNLMIRLIKEGGINASNFSLGGLYKALGEPDLKDGNHQRDLMSFLRESDLRESMDSSAFPKITGALINTMVQEGYGLAASVGEQLVTTLPSKVRDDTIVGFSSADQVEEVIEGGPYAEGSYAEKYHKIRNRKFGRIIGLTVEMIRMDQTGQMIMRAREIGEKAKAKHEEIIMKAICEYASTGEYASWRPKGTATALYSDTSTDPYSSATLDNAIADALSDETDIDSALAQFETFKDETGDYLMVTPTHLLCAPGKLGKAMKIANSTIYTVSQSPAGVPKPNIYNYTPVASPWVHALLGANYWLYGEFRKQFVKTEVLPLETFQERAGNSAEFERDVLYRYKTRLMIGCGAVTNRYVVRSTGAS